MWVWLLFALAMAAPEPIDASDASVVYYNARMALREGNAVEAVKLWLLRNAVAQQRGVVSPHDADFYSVTWAALGDLGICQDGHPTDEEGAGLWPLALHNWVVRNMGRKVRSARGRPFDAFQLGRQQRFVSVNDVLSAQELREVTLFRGACARQRVALVAAGESVTADLSDRQVTARLMLHLLEQAKQTLSPDHVRGRSAIDARRFDLYLQLTALSAKEARQTARERARQGRTVGLSRESVAAMSEDAPDYAFGPKSEAAEILREAADWSVDEWMALSSDRRRFLFLHVRGFGGDPEVLDATALGIIDALVTEGDGEEVERWIGIRNSQTEPGDPEAVWGGARGQRLLALEPSAGFRERGVVALHRGVKQLERGELDASMRSLSYALQNAQDSREGEVVERLSRRWLSYVASQFVVTDELLSTMQALVPRRDYGVILEDLMWRAAFRADAASFERGVRNQAGRGALERRVQQLQPLSTGDVGRFSEGLRDGLNTTPSETLRFIEQLLERLEVEDADVRAAQVATLRNLSAMLQPMIDDDTRGARQARTASELDGRAQAILEGLGAMGVDVSARGRARSLAPGSEVFAGSVRLAPSDPLPWPFMALSVPAPSVFMPFELTPTEWRGAEGGLVFGWSIGG